MKKKEKRIRSSCPICNRRNLRSVGKHIRKEHQEKGK